MAAADTHLLSKLCESAGPKAGEALTLATKLFSNVVENPADEKYRKLNLTNAKLQSGLFCHQGAEAFFVSAGFAKTADGCLLLPNPVPASFIKAQAGLVRKSESLNLQQQRKEMGAGAAAATSNYRAAVEGGCKGAGRAEADAIAATAEGLEALKVAERILLNVRRYPDSKSYRTVNLAKPAARKVLPALPLLTLAGFERAKLETGEDALQLNRMNIDVLVRTHAMAWWATRPPLDVDGLLKSKVKNLSQKVNHALGAMLGMAIGDALGAPIAGTHPLTVTAQEVDKALEMCGGGPFATSAGQGTANTELMCCHAEAMAPKGVRAAPEDALALVYGQWGQTRPVNAESACLKAFTGPMSGSEMEKNSDAVNSSAMGAGALCRSLAAAAGAGAAGKGQEQATRIARADACLSHPNAVLAHASAAYAILAFKLVSSCGDKAGTLQAFKDWVAEEQTGLKKAAQVTVKGQKGQAKGKPKDISPFEASGQAAAFDELLTWVKPALGSDGELEFATERGDTNSVKVALQHAIRHVKLGSGFEAAMRATLAGGGDSHSNAAAVGGLVGASVGLAGIPPQWIRAVLLSDSSVGSARPPEYHPKKLLDFVDQLCAAEGW